MNITQICVTIISLCVVAITGFVIPWLKEKYGQQQIDNAVSKIHQVVEEGKQVTDWIFTFVKAAQQQNTKYPEGADKKQYVQELIAKKLQELNITIDADILDAKIEAAVIEVHDALKDSDKVISAPAE